MITLPLIATLLPSVVIAFQGRFNGQSPILDSESSSPLNAKFDSFVQETLADWHIPGLAIAVIDGNSTYSKGYGIATYPDTAVTPDTLFFAASTTKAFTSAALSFLAEDNENFPHIQWDTPISEIIPDDFVLQDDWYTTHVTLEDAASHRSGLTPHDNSYPSENPETTTSQSWVRLFRHLPLTAPIRTKFQYSNLMYVALSHVIQTLVKRPLGDFIHERIWSPLNMTSTTFSFPTARESGKLARGYLWVESKSSPRFVAQDYADLTSVSGAGATISSVNDYAKWVRSLIYRLPPLSEAQHKTIMIPRTIAPQQGNFPAVEPLPFTGPDLYSLGWVHTSYRGELIIGHGGGLPGFGTNLMFIPSRGWGVVMMANTGFSSNLAEMVLTWELIDDLLDVPFGERFDWSGAFKRFTSMRKVWLDQAYHKLFPNLPNPRLPPTLRLEDYQGTYWHPAYAYLNLTLRSYFKKEGDDMSPPNHGSKCVEYLHVQPSYRPWNSTRNLYHVSQDYFLVDFIQSWPHGANVTESDGLNKDGDVAGKTAARFQIGPDGKVEKLGIALEEAIVAKGVSEGKKPIDDAAMMWFDKLS